MKNLRQEFSDTMVEIGLLDPNLVVLVGDISHGILRPYAKAYPERYYNIGICEPTIVNMAAGLNKIGLNPVVHTIAPFIIERAYEQIKLDFGYQKLSVNLVTVGGAFDYAQLGCSHHCYTDVSLITHLDRSQVVLPGSALEFNVLFKEIYSSNFINYYRLTENPHGIIFNRSDIKLGVGIRLRDGKDLTIAVTGAQLKNVIHVADRLQGRGISTEILYFHTLKPFDEDLLKESVNKTKRFISIEEVSAHGGLFDRCLKACIGINDLKVSQVAINDFVHGYGSYEDLCGKVGLTVDGIESKINKLLR